LFAALFYCRWRFPVPSRKFSQCAGFPASSPLPVPILHLSDRIVSFLIYAIKLVFKQALGAIGKFTRLFLLPLFLESLR
jgi:hypothetical protein